MGYSNNKYNIRDLFTVNNFELLLRLNLAIAFFSYGYSKFDGSMFNNTPTFVLDMPLRNVSMFHLTWYWFAQNKLLSIAIGLVQVLSSLLILPNTTKLFGALLALPILAGILIIDITIVGTPSLIARVGMYLLSSLWILYYNRMRFKNLMIITNNKLKSRKVYFTTILIILGLAVLGQLLEAFIVAGVNILFIFM